MLMLTLALLAPRHTLFFLPPLLSLSLRQRHTLMPPLYAIADYAIATPCCAVFTTPLDDTMRQLMLRHDVYAAFAAPIAKNDDTPDLLLMPPLPPC